MDLVGFTTVNQPLPTCPECGHSSLRTIESKQSKLAQRRRKKCDHCGHRVTTHEVTDEIFQELKAAQQLLNRIKDTLQIQYQPTSTSIVDQDFIPCSTCKHNSGFTCSFGFPEYDSPDAIDCNNHATP